MKTLFEALEKPDWGSNVRTLLKEKQLIESLDAECKLLALWLLGFIKHDKNCKANAFAFQMVSSSQHAIALASLGLYTPAAGSLRGMLESALYFLYFRSHPIELDTLVRDVDFYLQKSDVLQFFIKHVPDFQTKQACFGLTSEITIWYKNVSSVIHAQIPGSWGGPRDLNSVSQDLDSAKNIAQFHSKATVIINQLFLVVIGSEIWGSLSIDSRKIFLKGISSQTKQVLKLDAIGTA